MSLYPDHTDSDFTVESSRETIMASAKRFVLEIIQSLPDDCSVEDIQYEIYVRQRVAEGERAADEGKVVSHDQAMREAREWLGDL